MATMMAVPDEARRGSALDGPPTSPPAQRPTMMDTAGVGPEASSPHVQALQGLQYLERGAQLLSSSIPEMAPQLAELITGLRQAVPQAMAGAAGAGGGQPPMMTPPGMV